MVGSCGSCKLEPLYCVNGLICFLPDDDKDAILSLLDMLLIFICLLPDFERGTKNAPSLTVSIDDLLFIILYLGISLIFGTIGISYCLN